MIEVLYCSLSKKAGELNGRVDEKTKTVIFTELDEDYETIGGKVSKQTEQIRTLMSQLKTLRDDIELDKTYHKRLVKGLDLGGEMESEY